MQAKFLIYIIIGVLVIAGVAGASWYFVTRQPVPPVGPPEEAPLPVVQPSPEAPPKEEKPPEEIPADETADWKSYRNDKYGFEFKYPGDWETAESLSPEPPDLISIELGPKGSVAHFPTVVFFVTDQTEEEYFSSLKKKMPYIIISRTETSLGGKKATVVTYREVGDPTQWQWQNVFTQKNGLLFLFLGVPWKMVSDYGIFNQMLSTFRFSP